MGGSIHQDKKSGRFFISIYWCKKRYFIYRHPVTHEPFYVRESAEKQLGRIRTEIDEGYFNPQSWFSSSPLSTSIYAQAWLNAIKHTVSVKTHNGYRGYVKNYISKFFKDHDIRKIRHCDIVAFYSWINASGKTKYNVVSSLKTMLRYAWKSEDILRVPPFPKLSFNLPDIEYLTFDQQNQVLDFIPADDRPIFYFMQEYGVRPGEARALKKDCIKDDTVIIKRAFSDNLLIEQTKTGNSRFFDITEFIQDILNSLSRTLSPFVFIRHDGKPYTSDNLNKIWHDACGLAGIEIKMYNAFRHSLGCQLLDAGEDIDLVRQQLGHSKIEMTRRYAKRSEARLTEALNRRRGKVVKIKKVSDK